MYDCVDTPLKDYPLKVFSGAEIELSKFIQQLLEVQLLCN